MNYSIEITGGIGYHLMATSFVKWLNEKYPKSKINVISAFPEIFEYNPRVHRNLRLDQPYLFEDYIKNTDYRKGSPYQLFEYYRDENKMNARELFPKAFGFNKYNEDPENEIYFTEGEEMDGKVFAEQNGPYFTFQPYGGLIPGMTHNRLKIDSNQRDMNYDFACRLAHYFLRAGFKLVQIRSPSERPIPNTIQLSLPFRNLLPISKYSLGHIGIDSSMMHGSAIFKKPQLIFWGQTHKDNLGYKYEGFFNVSNKHGMHCRPHIQLPDRKAVFPFIEGEGKEFEYSNNEIESAVMPFLEYINLHKINTNNLNKIN